MEYHLCNFARNSDDNNYLYKIVNLHNRIKLFNQLYEGDNKDIKCKGITDKFEICRCKKCRPGKWTEPYKYYSNIVYTNTTFIKIDDDVLFITNKKINHFIETIKKNPKYIISSNIINNGVCAFFNKNLKNKIINSNILQKDNSIFDFFC